MAPGSVWLTKAIKSTPFKGAMPDEGVAARLTESGLLLTLTIILLVELAPLLSDTVKLQVTSLVILTHGEVNSGVVIFGLDKVPASHCHKKVIGSLSGSMPEPANIVIVCSGMALLPPGLAIGGLLIGVGVGEGEITGEGVGNVYVGEGVGVGDGKGEGLGDGLGVGFGEGVGLGNGEGVGVGIGDGDGTSAALTFIPVVFVVVVPARLTKTLAV